MPASLSSAFLLWTACAGLARGQWAKGGFVCQVQRSWDDKSIDGQCAGEYDGIEFMPGNYVPFSCRTPDCLLSGTLPAALASNPNIQTLWLKDNIISGTIPSEWGALGPSLLELDMANSRLSGTLPTELGLLTELTVRLDLSNNNISGTVPTELRLLESLADMRLYGNRLSGTVPGNFLPGLDPTLHRGLIPAPSLPPPSPSSPQPPPSLDVANDTSTYSSSGSSRLTGAMVGGILSGMAGLVFLLGGY